MKQNKSSNKSLWLAAITILVGVGFALLLVIRLNPLKSTDNKIGNNKENNGSIQKLSDTILIRMITDTVVNKNTTTNNDIGQQHITRPDSFGFTPQEGRWLFRNIPDSIKVEGELNSRIKSLNEIQQKDKRIYWWTLLTSLFFIVVTGFSAWSFTRELEIKDQTKRTDDPELIRLINSYEEKIIELNNHRKIIRFINKLKFQYYFLAEKGLFESISANEHCLILALLAMETDPSLMDTEKYSVIDIERTLIDKILDEKKEKTEIQIPGIAEIRKALSNKNNSLLKELIKLNANVLG